jgi:hypothetical protein
MWWVAIPVIGTLVIFSGLMSGLSMGFASLDQLKLNVVSSTGTAEERTAIARVQPLVQIKQIQFV